MQTRQGHNETEIIREYLQLSRKGDVWVMNAEAEVDQFLDMLNLLKKGKFRYRIISKTSFLRLRKAGVPCYKVDQLEQHA